MQAVESRGLSIFHRLLLAFLAVTILVSGAMSLVYYVFSKKNLVASTREVMAHHMQNTTYYFRHAMEDSLIRELRILATDPVLDEFMMASRANLPIKKHALELLLANHLRIMPDFEAIAFVDYRGVEVVRAERDGHADGYGDFGASPLFSHLEAAPPEDIAFEEIKSGENGPTFVIGINKTDMDIGQFGGVLLIRYNLANFLGYLDTIKMFGENPLWVFAADGRVLKQPPRGIGFLDPRPARPGPVSTANGGYTIEREMRIASRPFMRISISIPETLLLEEIRETLEFLAAVFLFSLLAALAVAFLVSGYLSAPIMKLADRVSRFSADHFPDEPAIKATGEVKVLVDSFARTARDLEKTTVSRDYVDNIFHTMLDALFVVTPGGRIRTVNAAARGLLGYSEGELLDQSMARIVGQENIPAMPAEGLIRNHEMTFNAKDGAKIPVLVSCNVMRDGDNQVTAIVCLARDITEKKAAEADKARLESRLRQAHKMEAIGTLAGGIAHDFNNILAAIIGYADLARAGIREGNDALEDMDEIIAGAYRAQELVKQILAFSRERDHGLEPLSPHVIVKEALKLLRASIPTTIEIRQDIDGGSGTILADPTKIHQVIVNLCTNGVQAMENEKGVLEVGLARREISPAEAEKRPGINAGPYVILTVTDTGHGMDQDVMERIFDPYFTTKDAGKGTGMGLAMVHGIVRECGGAIEVDSEPGRGATFRVYFPAMAAAKVEERTVQTGETPPGGHERILVIDDEAVVVSIQQRMLERLGYRVTGKTDSREALELFQAEPQSFDLVITDQTMPGLDGLELTKALLRLRPDLPVVLCTGYSTRVTAESARAKGIKEFVMKPIHLEDLARIVRRVLDEPRRRDERVTKEPKGTGK